MLCSRCLRVSLRRGVRWASEASTVKEPAPYPPLVKKMQTDLKTAMRARDHSRLNVLRAVISEVTNASKGPQPILTDLKTLSILRRRSSEAQAAANMYGEKGRSDLQEKEASELAVLKEYSDQVMTASEEEVETAVKMAIEGGAKSLQDIMKLFKTNDFMIEGKPAQSTEIVTAAKKLLS